MCTLIALHRCVSGAPLVVAANRDEYYDRPAEGPALRATPGGPVVAPLDAREGGTWLGLNARGLFAAVTNVAGDQRDPGCKSRGLLVSEALQAADAEEAARRVESEILEGAAAYNPFNLFVADRRGAWAVRCDGAPRCVELGPGAHVIGNVPVGEDSPKLARLRERVARVAGSPATAILDGLADVCRDHEGGGEELGEAVGATCVHTASYGTRSSTLLRLGETSGSGVYEGVLRYADGAPCGAKYRDFTPLLRELGRTSRPAEGEPFVRNAS